MLDIIRPPKVEVRIFGQSYTLRRIPLGETIDLLQSLVKQAPALTSLNLADWDPMRKLLRQSFPGFDEWDELSASDEMDLILAVFEANDFARLIENFTAKILPMLPKTSGISN